MKRLFFNAINFRHPEDNRPDFSNFMAKMDFNIKLRNGQILRGMIQSPGEDTRAIIIMVHGLGEHINRYQYWSSLFIREKIGFTGVDLPGHGRSDGRRGHIKNFRILREMIDILIDSCRKTFPGVPVFLYGQSMGGVIVLDYLLHEKPGIRGAVVTSPWLRLSSEPPVIKQLLASAVKYILPGMVQPSGLLPEHLSHDNSVVEAYIKDPLVHDMISASLFYGAMSAAEYSLSHAGELTVPVLLMHGSCDLITSPEGSREFASGTPLAELKIWDGGYHELHNEPFRDQVFEFIVRRIVSMPRLK
jgi:alpha-beta hydrolase superfamily lysophospholipase